MGLKCSQNFLTFNSVALEIISLNLMYQLMFVMETHYDFYNELSESLKII
jgi:hypothetical protein